MDVLTPADWPVLMTARLHALRESPRAFLADYHLEKSWGEDEWRGTFVNATWVIARVVEPDRDVVGLARSVAFPHRPAWERCVESVWVAPSHRGQGILGELLRALLAAEPTAGIKELWLWLIDSNDEARRTYQRLGFTPTGVRKPLPDGTGRSEERWHLGLAGGSMLSG